MWTYVGADPDGVAVVQRCLSAAPQEVNNVSTFFDRHGRRTVKCICCDISFRGFDQWYHHIGCSKHKKNIANVPRGYRPPPTFQGDFYNVKRLCRAFQTPFNGGKTCPLGDACKYLHLIAKSQEDYNKIPKAKGSRSGSRSNSSKSGGSDRSEKPKGNKQQQQTGHLAAATTSDPKKKKKKKPRKRGGSPALGSETGTDKS